MKTDASSVPFDVALEAVNAGSTRPKHIRRLLLAAGDELAALFEVADVKRRQSVGDAVHLRAIIEFSSHCVRNCSYCGLRVGNKRLARYRLSPEEIVATAQEAERLGYRSVVLQ